MSKKAIIQGEFHISPTDRKSLMNRQTSQFQALYCEGRDEKISPHHQHNRYNLFVIGILTLYLIYGTVNYIYSNIPLNTGYDIESHAKQAGLDFDDRIDLEIHEIFDSFDTQTVNLVLISLSGLLLLMVAYSIQVDTIPRINLDIVEIVIHIPIRFITLIFAILFPFLYSSLLISYAYSGDREEKMVRSISKKCDEQGHDSVLILVGDSHVEPVGEKLAKNGWEVEKNRSNNIFAQINRIFESN